ncbi:phytase [Sphingobium sufflavum]|uniref:phytase n=1 Tax=Sphingobium sufflavum TaxID=1129547 RepID=UPI001F4112D2|nr:phytase [Sphingobium sufflavum]MCE7797594.1 phytase [Sphingobium sufflavum]
MFFSPRLTAVLSLSILLAACAATPPAATPSAGAVPPPLPATTVPAKAETDPVGTALADAADDPAIWRNTANPAASLIVGTDKKAGLYSYGLDGRKRSFVAAGQLNNVDLRDGVTWAGKPVVLIGASDRTDRATPKVALFTLDGATGALSQIGSYASGAKGEAYGFCFGRHASGQNGNGIPRAYVVTKQGMVLELALSADPAKPVTLLRQFGVATQPEGCVVDDRTGQLYLGEEDVGIWRFDLNAAQPVAIPFAKVGAAQGLVADVEGLALAPSGEKGGLLVVSSQGDNAYALLDLADGALRGRFRIDGGAIDGTYETDGIELALGDFGPDYPAGLFVAQDGDNLPQAQNFKLVSWADIKAALTLP